MTTQELRSAGDEVTDGTGATLHKQRNIYIGERIKLRRVLRGLRGHLKSC